MHHLRQPTWNDSATRRAASSRNSIAQLLRDTRGSALLEYSILVGCVALGGCVGLVMVGVALLDSFEFVRRLILVPTP
jgi:Flp pilus assembly pilin Flp